MEIEIGEIKKNNNANNANIPTLDENVSYDFFFQNHMYPNIPCLIKNVTTGWESANKWTINDRPNFDYLSNQYGNCQVTIYKCNEKYFNSQKTYQSTFKSYLDNWNKLKTENQLHYLKDWHLKRERPQDNFYVVPKYFASDWLNEFLVNNQDDDYRFVYMGPKNTWTPFHSDVFSSFSWSVNVCGKKKWLFFKPGDENAMRNELNNLPYDVTTTDFAGKCIQIVQSQGDAVFVPSCWYHQVYNLEDTISINHNWINGCNVRFMWEALNEHLKTVVGEIDDCKEMSDFAEHCQLMLKASFGINYYKFYEMIRYIAFSRLDALNLNEDVILHNGYCLGKNHLQFDLKAIENVLRSFAYCNEVMNLNYFKTVDPHPQKLLLQVEHAY